MPSSLGPAEIMIILVVALIVLGPTKLPEAGRQVGKALAEVRRWTRDVKAEVNQVFDPDAAPPQQPIAHTPVAAQPTLVQPVATPVEEPPPADAPPDPASQEAPQPEAESAARSSPPPEAPPSL